MDKRASEGYRKLLAYQKARELQIFTNEFVTNLPKTKTFFDLADQMSRSGRSGSKNIVEGWKRNTTKEYFNFLGFSIGAVEELKDDAADIVTGVYPELMGLRGKMGERGRVKELGAMQEKGVMGVRGGDAPPSTLLTPLCPLTRQELDQLKFYPLDLTLPPIVLLFLKAKELNFLLFKLQKSLDLKMDNEQTKPFSQKAREKFNNENSSHREVKKYLEDLGLRRLENGKYLLEKGVKRE